MAFDFGNLKKQLLAASGIDDQSDPSGMSSLKERTRELHKSTSEKITNYRQVAGEKASHIADQVASTITDWTGRETSSAEVTRAAKTGVVVGATVGLAMAAGPMAGRAMSQGVRSSVGPRSATGVFPGASNDQSEQLNQDDLDFDQQQYEQLQDHTEYMRNTDDVIGDQIAYNESIDLGGFDY
jgi:hypothetical protein